VTDFAALAFKEGDRLKTAFHAETTDKIVLFTTAGKFFTLDASKLPGGRGHGEPVRVMVDMDNDSDVVAAFAHRPGRRLLLASTAGNGFLVPEAEVIANTRKGKQVMNVDLPVEARLCIFAGEGDDHVAIVGENRKLLLFPITQLPEMNRGKGVRLQKYKDGGVLDARTFKLAEGLSWTDSAGRVFVKPKEELVEWLGDRASAGRLAPKGFPRSGKFAGNG
jgi:topoisomerase-4 subunit A